MSESTENGADLPKIPTALLEALERQLGPFRPSFDWSERKIFFEMGFRAYLERLRVIHDRQREDLSVL